MRHAAPTRNVFAIKAAVSDLAAETFVFPAKKTMYGGKHIAAGGDVSQSVLLTGE